MIFRDSELMAFTPLNAVIWKSSSRCKCGVTGSVQEEGAMWDRIAHNIITKQGNYISSSGLGKRMVPWLRVEREQELYMGAFGGGRTLTLSGDREVETSGETREFTFKGRRVRAAKT